MTSEEIFDFYDENWNDYNKVMDMLHSAVDDYEDKIKSLENKANNQISENNHSKEVESLKSLLQECQDKLDEETHKTL
jgi:prefoldin subunit 5